jgi:ADP-heptose:LPS heptosyltransferase
MKDSLLQLGLRFAYVVLGIVSRLQVRILKLVCRPTCSVVDGAIQRILVVKLDELGDLAIAMPFLKTLRQQLPSAYITVVVNQSIAGLLEGMNDIKVLPVDVKCSRLLRPLILPLRHYRFVQEHLSDGDFDLCFIPRVDADDRYATFLSYFTKAKRRISFSEKSTRRKATLNKSFDLLLTDAVPLTGLQHEAPANLLLLERIGISIRVLHTPTSLTPGALTRANEILPADGTTYIAMCPTSGHSQLKQWGVRRFGELAKLLADQNYKIVLFGGPADWALGEQIEVAAPGRVINMIGKTSLADLTALLSRCAVFFGNDAGPMHVASMMGVSTVAVFGSSCHHRFGPWAPSSTTLVRPISCSPCANHQKDRCKVCVHEKTLCMESISLDDAFTSITSLLQTTEAPVS